MKHCSVLIVLTWTFSFGWGWTAEPTPEPTRRGSAETTLTFDPLGCRYLDRIRQQLALNESELALFRRQGFVVVDQGREYNFGTAYRHIYGRDLPVLITSDSLLHMMHRSFDNMLMELEENVLYQMLSRILAGCHAELQQRKVSADDPLADSYRDLDLYLIVARNLLAGVGPGSELSPRSCMNQDDAAQRLMQKIYSLRLEDPLAGQGSLLYGGWRPVDYSQFKPRGHYTKTPRLQNYFRAMMWLSRPDCGFNLAAHPSSGIRTGGARELRSAVLLVDLLQTSRQMSRLGALDGLLEFLVGYSDNLRPLELRDLLRTNGMTGLSVLANTDSETRLRQAVASCPSAQQKIRGQVIFGGKRPGESIPPPAIFQMLGQRFVVDAYVMAGVVYDTVRTQDERGEYRKMPRGLDVMAALGSPVATRLLEPDLRRWNYEPQLRAVRDFTAAYMADPANQQSLYNLWLKAICALHAESSQQPNLPQAMRTEAWRCKQLHAQLGSWAELCHDARILYVKQSYTSRMECEYPAGYVEPYPEFYACVRAFAQHTSNGLASTQKHFDRELINEPELAELNAVARQACRFWQEFASTIARLETLARKELAAERFAPEEERFLKDTVSLCRKDLGRCGKGPWEETYDGWYCRLLYPDAKSIEKFEPTVADVHTDPNGVAVLQVGVGHANLALVAVDNGPDRMAYVGPVYTYYEFSHPAGDRLTDEQFRSMLNAGRQPPRPGWTRIFSPGPAPRPAGLP